MARKKKISTSSVNDLHIALSSVASQTASKLVLENISAELLDEEMYENHEFSFENLVFEGGGNKGMAYVGALQVQKIN